MKIIIRKPDLNRLIEGIPKDFYEVMQYFNLGLSKKNYPFIPRKSPIIEEEIINLWVPSLKDNISLVAERNGEVIGSATCFFDIMSSLYEEADKREPGEIGLTVNPAYNHKEVGKLLVKAIIEELRTQGKKAICHIDAKWDEEIQMMKELGYKGKLINNYERYKKEGLSGRVFEYNLP